MSCLLNKRCKSVLFFELSFLNSKLVKSCSNFHNFWTIGIRNLWLLFSLFFLRRFKGKIFVKLFFLWNTNWRRHFIHCQPLTNHNFLDLQLISIFWSFCIRSSSLDWTISHYFSLVFLGRLCTWFDCDFRRHLILS